jgi:putative transposase
MPNDPLVIGKNAGWKQEISLGRRTNQNFVLIPPARFIQMLAYQAELVGIRVIAREESYTSKCHSWIWSQSNDERLILAGG